MITTEGDKGKYVELIRQIGDKIAVLNKQLEIKREKIAANPSLKAELEDIKETLSNTEVCFSQYDDVMIRRLVGLIRQKLWNNDKRVDNIGSFFIFMRYEIRCTSNLPTIYVSNWFL